MNTPRPIAAAFCLAAVTLLLIGLPHAPRTTTAQDAKKPDVAAGFSESVKPILARYCLNCHSTKSKKGSLDLERFARVEDARTDLKVWQGIVEQIEAGEMPPKERPQPSAAEKKQIIGWIRSFLDTEARARSGDPGHVPLRRLSNAEYNYTVRDLTGVDLQPAREFPADGAAGEGFTNAAEALTDISPALFTKYHNAARAIADHAVLLPEGLRFSPARSRRDWINEGTAALRAFYAARVPPDGRLPVHSYVLATVRHRAALAAGQTAEVAAREQLNAKYLGILFAALAAKDSSQPLDALRAKWRTAAEKDVPALAAEFTAAQAALWRTVKVGNYVQESWGAPPGSGYADSHTRQLPVDPPVAESVPLRLAIRPAPGQSEVVLHLSAEELGGSGPVVWSRPRFEAPGKPALLLRDYADFGAAYEVDYPSAFAKSADYLGAVVALANDRALTAEEAARRRGLDAAYLKRWSEVLAVEPFAKDAGSIGRAVPAVPLTLLEEKTARNDARPAVNGWRKKGTDLPVVLTNASDRVEQIPGRIPAKGVGVHPMPREFVAVVWTAPAACTVRVRAKIMHAHPACGNGVAWWLEHRRGNRAAVFGEGAVDLGGEAQPESKTIPVEAGDVVILAIDAKNNEHTCDMTAIELSLHEQEKPGRVWDLGADIATTVQAGNPHGDAHGHKAVWSFVRGPSRPLGKGINPAISPRSVLGQWREAASDPKRKDEAAQLASRVQARLSGPRPAEEKSPDRALYDYLVAVESPLFTGVDVAKLGKRTAAGFGLPKQRFVDADLVAPPGAAIAVKVPAALLSGREFAVDARLGGVAAGRLVRPRVAAAAPAPGTHGYGPLLGTAAAGAYKRLVAGNDEFRRLFPLYICFPPVVPTDEVVTLKLFHRDDEPLNRLFLAEPEIRQLDRLWCEQRFISRQPVAEFDYLPQFMAYTTQDTPKAFQQFFIDRVPRFKAQADEFRREEDAAHPRHLEALLAFAARAYRRPLAAAEMVDLRALYGKIRAAGATHDEAVRGALTRILVAPAFLFRIEQAPNGQQPAPVNDWELATRLSYFLWSSLPDAELSRLAAAGQLRDPKILLQQTRRMIRDTRTRALAIEFGTQWIHVRGFDQLDEKNEKLFPTFHGELRQAIYEESILFFLDLFQGDRPVATILDSDQTFVNETLAKHYGIPGVRGPEWRRIDGVKKYGRGGVLGLASVQAKQAGASRTSPILRGNWVVETLLGEKLPKPPPNVPELPEMEGADKLTMRQIVEKHVTLESCAACHVRIDPYGFALEKYDPIGRYREKENTGLPIDTRAKLRDGTEFDGIDGLRNFLLTKKKDVVVRLFCKRLLGYALGRATTLSDTALIDEMMVEMEKNGGRVGAAVQAIVMSKQFRMVRGNEFVE